jgi:uncharacterized membrane protein YphA (DoxX/SURF4 family)
MPDSRLKAKDEYSKLLSGASSLFLRFALGLSFLSAVADRFGLWGTFGKPHVSWGTFARFVAYTGQLNWFLPRAMIATMAVIATCLEIAVGILLILGWKTKIVALISGILLLLFAVTMAGALGIKAPFDSSVFTASGGAFVLASCAEYPFSIDQYLRDSARHL